METGRTASIAILISLIVIMIIYVIILFELYKQQEFIFAPYSPPVPPSNYFYPLGEITPLTQEEIEHRNAIIRGSTRTT